MLRAGSDRAPLLCLRLRCRAPVEHRREPPPVVKIIVGSAPGGILDPYARIVGENMSKTLGRTMIVENKPGASGTIATQFVVDQPADGAIVWVGTQAFTEINPSAYKNLRWTIDDFIPIVKGVEAPLILAVHPSVPAKNLNELVAWIKANPGKLGYASYSPGTPSAFLGHQLNKRFGLDLTHIVYRGSGPQTQRHDRGPCTAWLHATRQCHAAHQGRQARSDRGDEREALAFRSRRAELRRTRL